jgi:hypothetical protein
MRFTFTQYLVHVNNMCLRFKVFDFVNGESECNFKNCGQKRKAQPRIE